MKDPLGLHHAKHNVYLMVVDQRHCAMSSLFLSGLMCTSIKPCCMQDTIARLRRSIFPVIGQDTLINNQMQKRLCNHQFISMCCWLISQSLALLKDCFQWKSQVSFSWVLTSFTALMTYGLWAPSKNHMHLTWIHTTVAPEIWRNYQNSSILLLEVPENHCAIL